MFEKVVTLYAQNQKNRFKVVINEKSISGHYGPVGNLVRGMP